MTSESKMRWVIPGLFAALIVDLVVLGIRERSAAERQMPEVYDAAMSAAESLTGLGYMEPDCTRSLFRYASVTCRAVNPDSGNTVKVRCSSDGGEVSCSKSARLVSNQ